MLRLVERGVAAQLREEPVVAAVPDADRGWPRRCSGAPSSPICGRCWSSTSTSTRLPSLVRPDSPVLLVGAGDVLEGNFKIFSSAHGEIKVEALLASAAIPNLFPAVWVDGHAYWDGIFARNPPVVAFLQKAVHGQHRCPEEIWIIQVNRAQHDVVPEMPSDIFDRRNHLAGNLSLQHELQIIELRERADPGGRADRRVPRALRARLAPSRSRCASSGCPQELQEGLDYPSKLSRQPAHIDRLIADGEAQADAFLGEARRAADRAEGRGRAGREPSSDRSAPRPTMNARRSASRMLLRAASRGRRSSCRRAEPVARHRPRSQRPCRSRSRPLPCSRCRQRSGRRGPPPPHATQPGARAAARGGDRCVRRRQAGEALAAAPLRQGVRARVARRSRRAMPFRLMLNHVSQFKYTNTHGDRRDVHGPPTATCTRCSSATTSSSRATSSTSPATPSIRGWTSTSCVFTSSADPVGDGGRLRRASCSTRPSRCARASSRCRACAAMTGNYPFFHGTDRSLATNYFRPGFTQGIWANGEPLPGFNYIAMVGNSLNTLDIKSANIDNNFAYVGLDLVRPATTSASAWNDYEYHDVGGAARRHGLHLRARGSAVRSRRRPAPRTTRPSSRTACSCSRPARWRRASRSQLANFYLWAIDAGSSTAGSRSTSSSTCAG